ncbi:unnamed protein product [Phytophthora fragariaefolia]|uniref:Unnamed protein product n=1 Tax=Phytophthora fragariaefolia TaxID=1490495 RepID=A0A9W6WP71_9STRA|nr:unnamed protein product [Phytophthora fragariaefolia]
MNSNVWLAKPKMTEPHSGNAGQTNQNQASFANQDHVQVPDQVEAERTRKKKPCSGATTFKTLPWQDAILRVWKVQISSEEDAKTAKEYDEKQILDAEPERSYQVRIHIDKRTRNSQKLTIVTA